MSPYDEDMILFEKEKNLKKDCTQKSMEKNITLKAPIFKEISEIRS